jgi:1,4-dihydroxy-2-naphthoate octaprenyltransferase
LLLSLAVDLRLLAVGAACLLAGWLYTGGPRPYGYLGLGEVFVFLFFGLVATAGTLYVEIGRVTALAVWMACAMGFLATAILVLNNLRDIDTDAAAGKRTLATRIGRTRTRWLLAAMAAAAFAIPVVVSFSMPAVLITLLAAPIAWSGVSIAFASTHAPSLVKALKRMAIAELVYALLFALAMLL